MALFARRGVVRQARKAKTESSDDEEVQHKDQEQQHTQPRAAALRAAAAAATGQPLVHLTAATAQTADHMRYTAALTAAKSHAAAAAVAAAVPAELQLIDSSFQAALTELESNGLTAQPLLVQHLEQQEQRVQQQPKKKLLAAGACAVGSSRVFVQQQQQQQLLQQQQQAAAAAARGRRLSFGFCEENTSTLGGAAAAIRKSFEEELPKEKAARHRSTNRNSIGNGKECNDRPSGSRDADSRNRGSSSSNNARGANDKSLLVVSPPGSVGIVLKATHTRGTGSTTESAGSGSRGSSRRHEFIRRTGDDPSSSGSGGRSSRCPSRGLASSAMLERSSEGGLTDATAAAAAAARGGNELSVDSCIYSLADLEDRKSVAAGAAVDEAAELPFVALAQVARRSRQQARANDLSSSSTNKGGGPSVSCFGEYTAEDDQTAATGGNSNSTGSWLAKEAMLQLRNVPLLLQLSADAEEQSALEAWEREQIMKGAGRKQLLLQQEKLERRQRQQLELQQQEQEKLIISSFSGVIGLQGAAAAACEEDSASATISSFICPAEEPKKALRGAAAAASAASCFAQLWSDSSGVCGSSSNSSTEQQAGAAVAWLEEQAELLKDEQQQQRQQQRQQVHCRKAAATKMATLEVKQLKTERRLQRLQEFLVFIEDLSGCIHEKALAVKMAIEALQELEAADADRRTQRRLADLGPLLPERIDEFGRSLGLQRKRKQYGLRVKHQRQRPLGEVLKQLRRAPHPTSPEASEVFAACRASAPAKGGGADSEEGGQVDSTLLGDCECWGDVLGTAFFTSDEEGPPPSSSSSTSSRRHKMRRQFLQAAGEIFDDVRPEYKEVRRIVDKFSAACRSCPEDMALLQQHLPLVQQLQQSVETVSSWELLWWCPMDNTLSPNTPSATAAAVEWVKQQQLLQAEQQDERLAEETTDSGNTDLAEDDADSKAVGGARSRAAVSAAAETEAGALDSGLGPLRAGSVVSGRILRGGPDIGSFDFTKDIFAFCQEMETFCSSNSSMANSEFATISSDLLLHVVREVVFPRALHALQQMDCCSFSGAAGAAALLQEMLLFRAFPTETAVIRMLQLFVSSFLSTVDSQLPVHCVKRALQVLQQRRQEESQQQQQLQEPARVPEREHSQHISAAASAVEIYVHRTLKAVGVASFFGGILSEQLMMYICMHHLFELRLQPLLSVLPQRQALLAVHGFVRLLPMKWLLLLQQQQPQQQHQGLSLLLSSCLALGADLTEEADRGELLLLLQRISPQADARKIEELVRKRPTS